MYLGTSDNRITLSFLAAACGGTLHCENPALPVRGISVDSRSINRGDVFFAVRGERFDGFDFIGKAEEGGACCAVAERKPDCDIPYVLVKDARTALGDFAREYKKLFRAITVAVTGSVGKTTTKQYIASVLEQKFTTLKTEGNHNNDIGLPMTLLSLDNSVKMAVLEMGMSARGEISALSKLAEPDIGVITNIGNSHIEMLGSRKNICKAKMELADGMKDGSILLINGDEPLLTEFACTRKLCRLMFGIDNPACDYRALNIRRENGMTHFDVISGGGEIISDLCISQDGAHQVRDALAAVVCGILLGLDNEEIARGLVGFQPAKLRQSVIEKDGFTLILDCYNANPESMAASIGVLSGYGGRKLAVLGDMRELGQYSVGLHKKIGGLLVSSGIDALITLGEEAEQIAVGAKESGMAPENIKTIRDYSDAQSASEEIKKLIQPGDTVLIKASRALSLERIAELL